MGRKPLYCKVPRAPPPACLRLLVSPIRLMVADMWQIVKLGRVVHYGKLVEFIMRVTEVFPDILGHRDFTLLILALRARLIIKLCGDDQKSASKNTRPHIIGLQKFAKDLQKQNTKGPGVQTAVENFVKLVQDMLKDSDKSTHFFREVLPSVFGLKFDNALQSLMSDFLTRLEELMPVPDFKEAVSLLNDSAEELEGCFQTLTDPEQLKTLFLRKTATTNQFDKVPETVFGESLMSALCCQPFGAVKKQPLVPDSKLPNAEEEGALPCVENDRDLDEEKEEEEDKKEDEMVEKEGEEGFQDKEEDGMVETVEKGFLPHMQNNSDVDDFLEEDDNEENNEEEKKEEEDGVEEGREEECIDREGEENREEEVDQHVVTLEKQAEGEKGHECPLCGKACRSAAGLKTHIRLHSAKHKKPREVESSESEGEKNEEQSEEEEEDEGTAANEKGLFECPSCGKVCRSAAGLKKHKILHSAKYTLKCTMCKRKFNNEKALNKHLQVHAKHSALSKTSEGKKRSFPCSKCGSAHNKPSPPPCEQCGKRFCRYPSLYRHRKVHSGERQYMCADCGKRFTHSDILKAHMRTHTKERTHTCHLCGRRYAQWDGLARHMRTHTGEKPYACQTCEKAFYTKAELDTHQRAHSEERPHQCALCGKRFKTSSHLGQHMRTHTEKRPHVCIYCDKAFKSPDELKRHTRIHTGEKPYECPRCGKRAAQAGQIKVHLKTCTGTIRERPYQCQNCGTEFVRERNMKAHLKNCER